MWGDEGIRLIADSVGEDISNIAFCYDGNGGIFAFWKFLYEINTNPFFVDSLFIQHIFKNGERLWGENGIYVDNEVIDINDAWVVNDKDGGIYIQYHKRTNEYYIKKFDSGGNLNWTMSLPINFSKAIKDGYGGIIISGVKDTTGPEHLVINRISSDGEKLWGEDGIIVADSVDNGTYNPAEIFLNNDNTVSVFWDTDWYPNDELFLQRYTLEGEQIWEEPLNLSEFISPKGKAGIIKSSNNSNLIVWGEYRDSSLLFAQKIDESGNKLWNDDILIMSYDPFDEPNVITDGNDGAIIVWRIDPPWGGIYAQQISKDGNLGEVIVSVDEDNITKLENFYLGQNYPNPFNPGTKISWQSPVGSWQTLKVYDVLGREVVTLVNEYRQSGSYEIEFDGANLSSGIYLYQLQAGDFVETRKMILLR